MDIAFLTWNYKSKACRKSKAGSKVMMSALTNKEVIGRRVPGPLQKPLIAASHCRAKTVDTATYPQLFQWNRYRWLGARIWTTSCSLFAMQSSSVPELQNAFLDFWTLLIS